MRTTVRSAISLLFAGATLTACTLEAPTGPAPVIETTTFATSLGVNLSLMTKTATGLYYQDIAAGSGATAAKDLHLTVHYTGYLTNGTVFDSSVNKGEPATFALGGLIKAWQIGIPGMKPGGIRRLLVPSELGYGARGSPPKIPGGATLVFEVKLISFN